MSKKAKSVLDGGYVTNKSRDKDGNPKIRAIIKGTGPVMARASELAAIAVTGGVAIASVTAAVMIEDASWVQRGVMCAIPVLTYYPTKWGLYHALALKKAVVYTTALISFRRYMRQQHFDANNEGKWVIGDHKKAALEKRKRESKRANPDYKEPRLYIKALHAPKYEDAAVLYYEYEGQRFECMVFDTLANAQKMQAHLTTVGSVMKGYKGMAQGTLTSPDQYWDDGDVIEHEPSAS